MNSTDSDIPLQTNQKPADQGSIDKPSSPIPGLTELREGILKALRQDRHTLAAAMEKSEHWDIKDSVLSLTFNSPFESTFIEKENREIRDIIKEHTGWDLKIETIVKHKEESPLSEEIEEQVDLIRTVFRGTIIKRSQ